MTLKNRPSAEDRSAPSQTKAKKPYHKPEFRFEKVFETLALACGKINHTQATCKGSNKKVS
jgi:hypothetical protein